jgi:hypothetical protein
MKHILAVSTLVAIAALPSAANATTFLCKCATDFVPTVTSGALNKDDNNFTCDQTWTDNSTGHDTGSYNGNVKFSFPDASVKGKTTNVKFAARNLPGECLMRATDGVNEHQEWSGLRCDDSNQNVNNFDFVQKSPASDKSPAVSNIGGQMNTTSKTNKFSAFYWDDGDKHTLKAVCAQKK